MKQVDARYSASETPESELDNKVYASNSSTSSNNDNNN